MSIRVVQVRSSIGTRPAHRGTLRALGLGRVGKSNVLPDRPEIRGMIARVPHLVAVADVDEEPTPRRSLRSGHAGRRRTRVSGPAESKGNTP
jgi:large subunit ribosomal protein L30